MRLLEKETVFTRAGDPVARTRKERIGGRMVVTATVRLVEFRGECYHSRADMARDLKLLRARGHKVERIVTRRWSVR